MASRRRGAYLVYLLRANTPHRPRRLHRLSDMDGQGTDLLECIHKALTDLGPSMAT
ncbi:hypothetical protein SAMN05660748_1238 [Blastococcus aggregatus]|uniref:Uncharacterized protein n=1 Tax=Blastococcus aggregatus TaxID=38502 RepID=A0A285V369_9ACTN|nr:hypothetical protein SAMN05660748_1238 [Blastococcus aggregatus]